MQSQNNTPIDPNDYDALQKAYVAGCGGVFDLGWNASQGIEAVARAVCPDGYVVVPVTDLNEMLLLMGWYLGPQDSDLYKRLHSLIPEQEATR